MPKLYLRNHLAAVSFGMGIHALVNATVSTVTIAMPQEACRVCAPAVPAGTKLRRATPNQRMHFTLSLPETLRVRIIEVYVDVA